MKKVFIADCEPEVNRSLKQVFDQLGYDAHEARNIKNTNNIIEEVKYFRPNIVLLDVRIEKILTLEAIEKIKEVDDSIKVIVMSTYGGESDQETICEILACGAEKYLKKPINIEELLSIIKKG